MQLETQHIMRHIKVALTHIGISQLANMCTFFSGSKVVVHA